MSALISAARATSAAIQLLAPRLSAEQLLGGPLDSAGRFVVRVLGARQLAQAALTGGSANASMLALGAQVDTVHALSMLALAAADRRRRGAACASALTAAGFAAAGIMAARHASARPAAHMPPENHRQRWAAPLAHRLIPAPARRYLLLPV